MHLTGEEQRQLDAIAAAATPGTIELDLDGWQVKASPDLPFRRCNVAVPAPDAAAAPSAPADLAAVRQALHRHHRRLVVAVSSARTDHAQLDGWLCDQGLAREAPVQIMVADLAAIVSDRPRRSSDAEVTVEHRTIGAEPVGVAGTSTLEQAREVGYRTLLARVAATGRCPLAAVARLPDPTTGSPAAGQPAGLGLAVVDGAWVGIFGMITSPDHRRCGIGSALVRTLAAAAATHGASRAYLQVEETNHGAIALYERLGFTTSHHHHYRSEPAAVEHGTVAESGC